MNWSDIVIDCVCRIHPFLIWYQRVTSDIRKWYMMYVADIGPLFFMVIQI